MASIVGKHVSILDEKINNLWGELTNTSAKKEPLLLIESDRMFEGVRRLTVAGDFVLKTEFNMFGVL